MGTTTSTRRQIDRRRKPYCKTARKTTCKTAWIIAVIGALCVLLAADSADARRRCRRDADCDGLTNRQERTLGTNRHNADTDHDGLSDDLEVNEIGSDPKVADSDGDGMEDADEVSGGTDPTAVDSDGDGIEDGDDEDPEDDLKPKLAGPVDSVDVSRQTVTMFGTLVVDVSTDALEDGVTLASVPLGAFVTIKLNGSVLPSLVALKLELKDQDGDGVPRERDANDDGNEDDPGADGGNDDGPGSDGNGDGGQEDDGGNDG